MLDVTQVKKKLEKLLAQDFPKTCEIGKEEYFVDHNVMSSLDFMKLIISLEQAFKIKISDEEVSEDNLGSTKLIQSFLEKKVL